MGHATCLAQAPEAIPWHRLEDARGVEDACEVVLGCGLVHLPEEGRTMRCCETCSRWTRCPSRQRDLRWAGWCGARGLDADMTAAWDGLDCEEWIEGRVIEELEEGGEG